MVQPSLKKRSGERKQMKREFLQNFKVGDQPLPDVIIQAILDEHGKGIEREKAKYADYDTLKE